MSNIRCLDDSTHRYSAHRFASGNLPCANFSYPFPLGYLRVALTAIAFPIKYCDPRPDPIYWTTTDNFGLGLNFDPANHSQGGGVCFDGAIIARLIFQ